MASDALLQAEGLCTFYGTSQALFDVSLRIPSRGGVAILGRNGAGKTTLLKTLAGDLRPVRGKVSFDGRDATQMPTERRVRLGLGHVPQEQAVFAGLTVRENLLLGAMGDRSGHDRTDEMVALFPRLGQRMSQRAGTLSGGERKMLAISRALLCKPHLLMLDEPTEGVWHGVVDEITERLVKLSETIAIVLVEQHVKMALSVAKHCYVMDRGHVALEGPTEQVRDDPELVRLLAP
ncbi:MAG: ABC transporter ATP-binding protein [Betaproteobacteria bacterium]|jgi:branched-chain amino acid transport system ATP-binding protein|nr:ABC transporter ATP-binding protein [Rhodocyclaceae bacterium]MCA3135572.1 ABC transporter ATP-binding protein [Rhodocyclaceae bacterium]MCA3141547.1 ABC transporter ATP-binding protein [Rhodocyclaceae bacterium]MCA3146937.1 ABC transporter ATP-binding protein [Rhodocyclaceae bacterium]MCE2897653.1 ABC transporter ATP-binding protein [Betaproteobacteria bacterium]